MRRLREGVARQALTLKFVSVGAAPCKAPRTLNVGIMVGSTDFLLGLEHSLVGDSVAHAEVLHVDSMALDGLDLFLKNSAQTSAQIGRASCRERVCHNV